jgi:hypothetical protein
MKKGVEWFGMCRRRQVVHVLLLGIHCLSLFRGCGGVVTVGKEMDKDGRGN